jgi:hypothetical protein
MQEATMNRVAVLMLLAWIGATCGGSQPPAPTPTTPTPAPTPTAPTPAAPTPPTPPAGNYTLTFVTESNCADLPADVRTRTYAATVVPLLNPDWPPNSYRVLVAGTTTWCCSGPGEFNMTVSGNSVAVTDDTGDQVLDEIPPFRYLEFSVSGDDSAKTPTMSAISFQASLDYCELRSEIGRSSFCRFVPADRVIRYIHFCSGQIILTRR